MLDNSHILITGGTGTLGHALVRLLLAEHSPRRVVILSRDEFKQSEMRRKFSESDTPVRYFIGDVRDGERLRMAFRNVDYVIHAAALKQVPACEFDPLEAIKTNVHGAENVILSALECGVKRVVNISTDKAIGLGNIYGATKATAERLFTQANVYGKDDTRFASCRLGNLVGSRGSVVQIWAKAEYEDTPIIITDPSTRRFWVTVEGAARLALYALADMQGGEVYVPRCSVLTMGELADIVAPSVPHHVSGPRPGDRADEELMTPEECKRAIEVDGHYIIPPLTLPRRDIDWARRGRPFGRCAYETQTWPIKANRSDILTGMGEGL